MEAIPDPVVFLEELGGLHDAQVNWFCYDADELRLDIDNLNALFMDWEEPNPYGGQHTTRPATLVFSGVRNSSGHFGPATGLGSHSIMYAEAQKLEDGFSIEIAGGSWVLMYQFARMSLDAAGEPAGVTRYYAKHKI